MKKIIQLALILIMILSYSVAYTASQSHYALGDIVSIGRYRDPNDAYSLAQAKTTIGADNKQLVINEPITLYDDCNMPDNIAIKVTPNGLIGLIHVDLVLHGDIDAGMYQIFDVDANSSVSFGENVEIAYGEWFGIDGTDDEVQINLALASGVSKVQLLEKTYTCGDEITVPLDVSLIGQGPDETIIDCNNADGSFSNDACIYVAGTGLTSLGALSGAITRGDKTVTCPSAPSISRGDIMLLYDSNDYSYSLFRSYYRAGEYGVVNSISGSDITLVEGTFASYALNGAQTVYKFEGTSSQIKNLQIIGRGTGNSTNCLTVKYGRGAVLENIKARNSSDTNISFSQCYGCFAKNIISRKLIDPNNAYGTAYALIIGNSQNMFISDSDFTSTRHGLAIGGGSAAGCVTNRNIRISNCNIHTTSVGGNVLAADMHGNCEYVSYENCTATGINMSGNNNKIIGCTIHGDAGELIHIGEPVGFNFTIRGNTIYAFKDPPSGRGVFVDVGGGGDTLTSDTELGGVFTIADNKFHYSGSDEAQSGIVITNRGCTQTDLRIVIKNNELIGTYSSRGNDFGVYCRAVTSGAAFADILVENNLFYSFGISAQACVSCNIHDNTIIKSGQYGILATPGSVVSETPTLYTFQNNIIKESRYAGIYVSGDPNNVIEKVVVSDNVSIENVRVTTGSSASDVNLGVGYATEVHSYNNFLGSDEAEQNYPFRYAEVTELYEDNNEFYGTGSPSYSNVDNQEPIAIDPNDTTPDVSKGYVFITSANSNATAITDLDNPRVGKTYTIIGGSATNSSTIGDSGNFALSAGWTAALDDVLILYVQADNDYIEIGRVNN